MLLVSLQLVLFLTSSSYCSASNIHTYLSSLMIEWPKKPVSFWPVLLCTCVIFLMLSYITKWSSVFSSLLSSLPISLIAFSPIQHSGAAPAHWLKPFCSQVIFFFPSSKITWLTLLFDSISLCVLGLFFNCWSNLCVWYINGALAWLFKLLLSSQF